MSDQELYDTLALIEFEPQASYKAAQILRQSLYIDNFENYAQYFPLYIERAINEGLLSPRMNKYDLAFLAETIAPERDGLFQYLGMKTLIDRYLLRTRDGKKIIEMPQAMWMRVAMGIALNEKNPNQAAIEFYHLISQLLYTPATPTLFNAGRCGKGEKGYGKSQMSSCYLSVAGDDIKDIFKCISDNANLSKWAGGLGNSWTNVRALGSIIKGTNGNSQGVIPFLKIVNDTVIAVNQGGKRPGAACVYLENWHLDIQDFLDLRKNTGDERRRCHDLHTACWISDEFMHRVETGDDWTLFSPDDVPDLHDLYGEAFSQAYRGYEGKTHTGEIELFKRISARELWREMLTSLYETGHPWITFKDPSNICNPQDHCGVIHSSNLCTEILLNTNKEEIAVCNLGSLNLAAHLTPSGIDYPKLAETITTAVRMLDNVIDINYYPVPEAENSNRLHRPIGLGIMGLQDVLYALDISYDSSQAVDFCDTLQEFISLHAIKASAHLAAERESYPSFKGSKWDRGILPIDRASEIEVLRGREAYQYPAAWEDVRDLIAKHGIRNSNIMAIAPTATISNIVGVSQSIEPEYKNLYVKSNLSGDFTRVNTSLVADLKKEGLWDREMLDLLKYFDGSIQNIDVIPEHIRNKYKTAFEINQHHLIACAAARQKWIDQSQSLNLYMSGTKGKALLDLYTTAWRAGLKTTYYLRSQAATTVEKSALNINKFGIQPRWMENESPSAKIVCAGPTCEACS